MTTLQRFVNLHFEKGNNLLMFNHPVKELSREELIACVGYLSEKTENQRSDYHNTLQTLSSLRKRNKRI